MYGLGFFIQLYMQVFWMTIRYFKYILPCTFTINNCIWNYADFPYACAHRAASSYAERSCMLHLLFPPRSNRDVLGAAWKGAAPSAIADRHAVPTAACPAGVITCAVCYTKLS